MKAKINGAWRDGIPHVKIGNTWKKAIAEWVKISGVWKRITYAFSKVDIKTFVSGRTFNRSKYAYQTTDASVFTSDPSDYPLTQVKLVGAYDSGNIDMEFVLTFNDSAELDRLVADLNASREAYIEAIGEYPVRFTNSNTNFNKSGQTLTIESLSTNNSRAFTRALKSQGETNQPVTIIIKYLADD